MDVDAIEANTFVLNEMLKVEIEMKVEHQEISNHSTDHQLEDYSFSFNEIMTDPNTNTVHCRLCLEELTQASVTDHMITVHKYRKVHFKCWNCETTFKERILLTVHRQSCQPKKKQKKTMQRLIKEADQSDESVCPVCFLEIVGNLKEHIISEHGKKPAPVVSNGVEVHCETCGKSFKSKVTLGQHIRLVHQSVQDSHGCPQCGVCFSSHKYLANHVRNVHPTGDKVHRCETCSKNFKSHQSLYQHNKNVHLGGYLRKRAISYNNT